MRASLIRYQYGYLIDLSNLSPQEQAIMEYWPSETVKEKIGKKFELLLAENGLSIETLKGSNSIGIENKINELFTQAVNEVVGEIKIYFDDRIFNSLENVLVFDDNFLEKTYPPIMTIGGKTYTIKEVESQYEKDAILTGYMSSIKTAVFNELSKIRATLSNISVGAFNEFITPDLFDYDMAYLGQENIDGKTMERIGFIFEDLNIKKVFIDGVLYWLNEPVPYPSPFMIVIYVTPSGYIAKVTGRPLTSEYFGNSFHLSEKDYSCLGELQLPSISRNSTKESLEEIYNLLKDYAETVNMGNPFTPSYESHRQLYEDLRNEKYYENLLGEPVGGVELDD